LTGSTHYELSTGGEVCYLRLPRYKMIIIQQKSAMMMCRVSDASGSIEYSEVKVGSIRKSDLDSNVRTTM